MNEPEEPSPGSESPELKAVREALGSFDAAAAAREALGSFDAAAAAREALLSFDAPTAAREALLSFDAAAAAREALLSFDAVTAARDVFRSLNTSEKLLGLSPQAYRQAAASLASVPVEDLMGVWKEASARSEDAPSTEGLLSRLQVDVPSLPPAVLVFLVVCFVWLVAMGILSTASFENSDSAKEFISLTGLSPAVVSTALAGWSGHAVKRWQQRRRANDETD